MIHMKKKKPAFIHYAHRRVIKRNQNCLICLYGGTGSGKSYASISAAQAIARYNGVEFDTRHICMNATEFMRLLNSGELKRGSVVIMDEAGVAVNAKDWQSRVNKVMNYVMQTFRHENYVVIFNTPSFSFVDSSMRKMFHMKMETQYIDYERDVGWTKTYVLNLDHNTGNVYTYFFRVKVAGETPYKVVMSGFGLANKDLLKKYEAKKRAFTEKLNKQVQDTLEVVEEGGTAELTERQDIILRLWNDYGLKGYEIAEVLDVAASGVSNALKACKKKGHMVSKGSTAKSTMSKDDIREAYERVVQAVKPDKKGEEEE